MVLLAGGGVQPELSFVSLSDSHRNLCGPLGLTIKAVCSLWNAARGRSLITGEAEAPSSKSARATVRSDTNTTIIEFDGNEQDGPGLFFNLTEATFLVYDVWGVRSPGNCSVGGWSGW
jgi:hypothetical protein